LKNIKNMKYTLFLFSILFIPCGILTTSCKEEITEFERRQKFGVDLITQDYSYHIPYEVIEFESRRDATYEIGSDYIEFESGERVDVGDIRRVEIYTYRYFVEEFNPYCRKDKYFAIQDSIEMLAVKRQIFEALTKEEKENFYRDRIGAIVYFSEEKYYNHYDEFIGLKFGDSYSVDGSKKTGEYYLVDKTFGDSSFANTRDSHKKYIMNIIRRDWDYKNIYNEDDCDIYIAPVSQNGVLIARFDRHKLNLTKYVREYKEE
jgi:hypothetical protein